MTLPFLTAEIPGCGGAFKETPEDFEVEELPAYQPNGEGEHLFLWVEKRGRTTQEVGRLLARQAGLEERDIGWAGLKDRQAVTRQYFSVPFKKGQVLETFEAPGVKVLRAMRHGNKLKGSHLAGNRFTLWVRGVTDAGAARATVEKLSALGLPNWFGAQRFGHQGDNAAQGKAILQSGGRHRDRHQRKLLLSAYQSELFNRLLARRLESSLWARALLGDVLKKHASGGEFVCEAPEVDQPRVDAFELSPTGPMFGPEMRQPGGQAAELEALVLAEEGITLSLFDAGRDETKGTRRLLRVPLGPVEFEQQGADLKLQFELPPGSYATVVLRELLKAD